MHRNERECWYATDNDARVANVWRITEVGAGEARFRLIGVLIKSKLPNEQRI